MISLEYDDRLDLIDHYRNYPKLKVWVGCNYSTMQKRLLLIGESHYLDKGITHHHDVVAWYTGGSECEKDGLGWINTRAIIQNGIDDHWASKGKSIYRNIERALFETLLFKERPRTAFTEVAFMNYFQRPAEKSGESIKVFPMDAEVSARVLEGVVNIIAPDAVIFTSSLAWRHAKLSGISDFLRRESIAVARAPHPGMPWWNRVSKKYGNKTGKNHFVEFVNRQMLDLN